MANYITVDGGTTNTRIYLVKDRVIVDTVKIPIGAGNGKEYLKTALRDAIALLLSSHGMTEREFVCILASGMITSEYGLCPLLHLPLPAGKLDLHNAMQEVTLADISEIPFVFLRGVKSVCPTSQTADMMRGEETELMGILCEDSAESLYVLPGSHSKLISVDREGRIVKFQTMMTGEMLAALSQHTILRDAVDLSVKSFSAPYLLRGYECCRDRGINYALFQTRVLKNLFSANAEECYGFFLGVVLCGEISEILKCEETTVVLGGQKQLREAMAVILERFGEKNVIVLRDECVNRSTSIGAIKIFEGSQKLQK